MIIRFCEPMKIKYANVKTHFWGAHQSLNIGCQLECFLPNTVVMPYSEKFFQRVNLGILPCLLMLSAEMRRQKQQQNAEETGQDPREHDERDP